MFSSGSIPRKKHLGADPEGALHTSHPLRTPQWWAARPRDQGRTYPLAWRRSLELFPLPHRMQSPIWWCKCIGEGDSGRIGLQIPGLKRFPTKSWNFLKSNYLALWMTIFCRTWSRTVNTFLTRLYPKGKLTAPCTPAICLPSASQHLHSLPNIKASIDKNGIDVPMSAKPLQWLQQNSNWNKRSQHWMPF